MCAPTNTLTHTLTHTDTHTFCTQLACCGNSSFHSVLPRPVSACIFTRFATSWTLGRFKDCNKSLSRFPGDELIESVCCTCQSIFMSYTIINTIVLDDNLSFSTQL